MSSTSSALSEAVVLAAGEGRRLRPLTRYQPKPMLRVGGRPILEYPIEALVDAGIDRAVIVVGHGSTRIRNHFENEYRGLELSYAMQDTQLGSGHALQVASDQVNGDFLVVNGDNVIDESMVRSTVDRYYETDAAACLAVVTAETPTEYGTVEVRNGVIERIDEREIEGSSRINSGVYVFDQTIFDALSRTDFESGERPITGAIEELNGRVVATIPNGVWFDPSYPWDLLSANETLLSAHTELAGATAGVDPTAFVHETAVIEDHVLIGPNCNVSAGAIVRAGTSLHANTTVGENAVLEGSIVGPDSRVGANALLRDTVVGTGVTIGDGTVSPGRSATLVVDGQEYADRRLGGVIADRAVLGANVTVEPGCRVGPRGTVAPGVTLRDDVPEGAEVVG